MMLLSAAKMFVAEQIIKARIPPPILTKSLIIAKFMPKLHRFLLLMQWLQEKWVRIVRNKQLS